MHRNSLFPAAMVIGILTAALSSRSEEPENVILGPTTFWRCHYTLKPPVLRRDGQLKAISIPEELKVQDKKSQPQQRSLGLPVLEKGCSRVAQADPLENTHETEAAVK